MMSNSRISMATLTNQPIWMKISTKPAKKKTKQEAQTWWRLS